MATAGAYVFYILHVELGLPAVPTAVICLLVLGPLIGLGLEAMARRLAEASTTMKIVATVGLVLAVQGFFSATFGDLARTVPPWLPQTAFHVAGVYVGEDQMIITGVALAATIALFAFFRFTRLGPGHTRRGRQSGAARPGGYEPDHSSAVVLDHRFQLRRPGGHPSCNRP